MDPNAAIRDLIDALDSEDLDYEEIDNMLDDLREWIRKGGFVSSTRLRELDEALIKSEFGSTLYDL